MTTIMAGNYERHLSARYKDVRARLGVSAMKPQNNLRGALIRRGDIGVMADAPFAPLDPVYEGIKILLEEYQVPWRAINHAGYKTRNLTLARAAVCVFLTDVTDFTSIQIGRFVARDHSSVAHYRKKYGEIIREKGCFSRAIACVKHN